LFENLFDLKPARVLDMDEVGLRIATLKASNVDLELIQYMDQREGIARRTMGDRKGINHVSFRVKDVFASLEQFQQKGAEVIDGFPRQGSHGLVAFFRPESTAQILLEICERKG